MGGMVRYTVFFNGELVKVYDLDEPVVFIGRLPENHIPITNMGISRRHVKIELDPSGGYVLTDLNSLNGTLVNGKKVKRAELRHGDKIVIGKYTIIYEDLSGSGAFLETIMTDMRPEELRQMAAGPAAPTALPAGAPPLPYAPAAQAAPAPFTPFAPPPAAPAAPASFTPFAPPAAPVPYAPAAPAPPPAPAAEQPAAPAAESVAVLIETMSHVVYRLDRSYLTIGSNEMDDIYVNKGAAVIEQRDGGFYISVQKMMAKLKINGKGVKSHRLEHRDRIEIGSNTFRFMENG